MDIGSPQSPQRLVPRNAFAQLAGVSKPAITKACKGRLAPACVGTRIDLDHPAALAYLARGLGAPTALPPIDEEQLALLVVRVLTLALRRVQEPASKRSA